MIDEKVVMCDFKGIKEGMLVRVDESWRDMHLNGGEFGVVLDRVTYPHMLGEGDHESYDAMLVVLLGGRRIVVPAESVARIDEPDAKS
jgi:hypothetical protein